MKSIDDLANRLNFIRSAKKAANMAAERLAKEVEKIDKQRERYGKSDVLDKKEAEVRAEHAAEVLGHLQGVVAADIDIAAYKDSWLDIEHVLSTRPVSKAMPGSHRAADPNNEALARMALAAELKSVSVRDLTMRATDALREGRHGELYLIHIENQTRQGSPGWQPIDFSSINLPDMKQARQIFAESRAVKLELALVEKSVSGRRIDPTETLSYGHALAELEAVA